MSSRPAPILHVFDMTQTRQGAPPFFCVFKQTTPDPAQDTRPANLITL